MAFGVSALLKTPNTNTFHAMNCVINRGVFRTRSEVYDGVFFAKIVNDLAVKKALS